VRCRIWPGTWWIGSAMTAAELIARLSELDPGTVVIVTDPVQWLSCHMELADVGPWAVLIKSTGRIITEEDIS
jgi:hypothetical protein